MSWKVVPLNPKQYTVYQAIEGIENPEDIGNILMCHITNNMKIEDRVAAIKLIIDGITTDIYSTKPPTGELGRIRNIVEQI